MSKIIATSAIKGAYQWIKKAEEKVSQTIQEKGKDQKVEFPDTAYFLPVIYGLTGIAVRKVSDLEIVLNEAKLLLPPVPTEKLWLPYLGHALDAGIATLFAMEVIEACKYLVGPHPVDGIWLGAADDIILRERGIEFVNGTAPGFATCVGAMPTNEIAVKIARELQEKNLYVFMASETSGKSMAEQLREENVQLGWETRLVPFGKDTSSAIYALGFATRAALTFGGIQPGDYKKVLLYNKNRIFAFVLALGEVTNEKYAAAAGAINYGFPTIADTNIPQILPTGVCTYEHVVSQIPHDKIVTKAIEVRGLKITISKIPIPVSYGPAFEGERIRKEDTYVEAGGGKTPSFEYTCMKKIEEVEDGKIELIGKDIDDIDPGTKLPLGIVVEVAGRKMQEDFEPILERQIHRLINQASGVWHMGQRDSNWIRISKEAKEKGFKIKHLGTIIYAKFHEEYNTILDKIQVRIYTDEKKVIEIRDKFARFAFCQRDRRIAELTDEAVNVFYSCTLCQSFAPNHVCIITPERTGLCGAYNWLDGKAAYQIQPTGPNQPILKEKVIDELKGQWQGINEFIYKASHKHLEKFNNYSIMEYPPTSCGCFECISVILPLTNGIMIVNRGYSKMTPCGMKFSTLAGSVGGGNQTPGFLGHSKHYIGSKKFLKAENGIKRIVWMPKELKEEIKERFEKRAIEIGIPNLLDLIADETIATTEEEVLTYINKVKHPVLELLPLM